MEKGALEDLGVDGRTILKWVFKNWDEGMDLVVASQNSDRFRALVIVATNLFFFYHGTTAPSGPTSPHFTIHIHERFN